MKKEKKISLNKRFKKILSLDISQLKKKKKFRVLKKDIFLLKVITLNKINNNIDLFKKYLLFTIFILFAKLPISL